MFRNFLTTLAVFVLAIAPCSGIAQTDSDMVKLPRSFTDFAFNPDNGAICCIDHVKDEAVVIATEYLDSGNEESLTQGIRLGSSPACVSFKRYGDKAYFVVACTRDSHLHVIDANTFKIAKRIVVAQSGVSWVINSRNPKDPFVYYCYGGGHNSMTGAIDVRKMVDRGMAFDDSMDCMVSADGKTAYRRGPWSPSGFESLLMTSSFEDDKPVFTPLFSEHRSTAQYLPDSFGELTAAGNTIYTKDLKKKVSQTDNVPVCFLISKPFVVCASGRDRHGRSTSTKDSLKLSIVSTNTFNRVGDVVTLPRPGQGIQIPRGSKGSADFKRVTTKTRYFVDEKRKRILVTQGEKLRIVSFEEFNFPDEVLMRIPQTEFELSVGKSTRLSLAPTNENVKVEIDDIPEGAKFAGTVLTWTPTSEQVGSESVSVRMKYKDVERQQIVRFTVSQPSISLPDEFTQLSVSPDGQSALAWIAQNSQRQSIHRRSKVSVPKKNMIALVDLKNGKVTRTREMPFAISAANVDSHFVYVASSETNYCQLLSRQDLKKVKTLYSDTTITKIETDDKTCSIASKHYTLPSLKLQTLSKVDDVMSRMWDFGRLSKTNTRAAGDSGMQRMSDLMKQRANNNHRSNSSTTQRQPVPLISGSVVAWRTSNQRRSAVRTFEVTTEIGLDVYSDVSGGKVKSIKLSSKTGPRLTGSSSHSPAIQLDAHESKLYVLAGDELFSWDAGTLDRTDLPESLKLPEMKPQLITEKGRKKFAIKPTGGEKPFEFVLLSAFDGIEIEETGNIVVDGEALNKHARELFVGALKKEVVRSREGKFARTLSNYENEVRLPLEKLTRKSFPKMPVKVDVRYRAVDSESQSAEGVITLIVGIEKKELVGIIDDASKEREKLAAEKKMAIEQRGGPNARKTDGSKSEISQLREKIDTLEARLDMMSRQMNQVMKLLEEKKPVPQRK